MGNNLDKYLSVRDMIDTGDGLLWKGNSVLGRAIRIWSPSYNHASIVFNEFKQEVNDEGMITPTWTRKHILEALDNGIVLRQISKRLEEYDGEAYWLPVKDQYKTWREGVGSWALDQVGTKYDYGSIIKNMFGRASLSLNLLFCSEYLYGAWRWEAIRRILGTNDREEILSLWKSKDFEIFGFSKAPRPAGILKMPIWEKPVQIL